MNDIFMIAQNEDLQLVVDYRICHYNSIVPFNFYNAVFLS